MNPTSSIPHIHQLSKIMHAWWWVVYVSFRLCIMKLSNLSVIMNWQFKWHSYSWNPIFKKLVICALNNIETTRTFIPVVKSHIFIAATPTLHEKVMYMAFFHYLYIYYAKCGYRFMNKCELEIFSNKMTLLTI